jgi:glycosyltransferase involved in cell wall biosynthesis
MDKQSGKQKRILVITYAFPPVAYVGVHRTLKYCRYLSSHQWMPVVLTSRPSDTSFKDEKLCQQIPPEVEVYRTADFDPAMLIERLSRLRRRTASTPIPRQPAVNDTAPSAAVSPLSNLKRCVEALLTQSPDSHVFWLPFALLKGIRILLGRNVDVIYTTSPPHSSHIAAFLLGKLFNKPYILDFRDPWRVGGSLRAPGDTLPTPWTLQSRLKRVIIRNAAKVICVSKGECDELRAEFPELQDEHFTYITNGYDPDDMVAESHTQDRSSRLTLIHAGTIYSGIAGEFFEALQQLVAQEPKVAKLINVHLVGETAREYADAIGLLVGAGIVMDHGLQPHGTTLRMVQASDVLVILLGGTTFRPSHLPSKVFEYLHAGKPIFAITQEGELAEIVRQSGLGIIVPPQSVDRVLEALRILLADHAAGGLARVPNQSYIRSFERAALTEKLARVLDAVKEAELVQQHCPSR